MVLVIVFPRCITLASVPPGKEEISGFVSYLSRQVEKSGVQVRLNTEVTAEFVRDNHPDAVVLACGATPKTCDIPGSRRDNVVSALDVLSGRTQVGQTVVVLGGQLVGCETAEYLAMQGKEVTILGRRRPIGQDISPDYNRRFMLKRLKEAGVELVEHAETVEITAKGVNCLRGGEREFIPSDTVVLALGATPNDQLAKEVEGYRVGDCVSPARIVQTIETAFRAACEI